MAYTSSTFIFFVLSGLLVAAFLPLRIRMYWMIALGLGWFASWNIYIPLIVVPLIGIHHFCGIKKVVWPALVISILTFCVFRIYESELAVGSSFYLLILLGYTIDVANRKNESLSWDETLFMGSFFPVMMSGPVVRSNSFFESLREDKMSWDNFFDGTLVFACGFLKFVLFHEVFSELSGIWKNELNPRNIILGALFATVSLYLSLSSFADMGRGIARAFGILVTPSFLPVFFARDPADFWERWNRTVAGWFRDYMIFPSLLRWGRKIPAAIIIFCAFIVLGLWHGFERQWILFGVFNGVMVILGSAIRKKFGLNFSGRILVFILILGNGMIEIADDIALSDPKTSIFSLPDLGAGFYLSFILYLIFEWLQERKEENDFFLRWHPGLKKAIVIGLFILWVFFAEHREPTNPETLPLYFDL